MSEILNRLPQELQHYMKPFLQFEASRRLHKYNMRLICQEIHFGVTDKIFFKDYHDCHYFDPNEVFGAHNFFGWIFGEDGEVIGVECITNVPQEYLEALEETLIAFEKEQQLPQVEEWLDSPDF